MNSFAHIHYMTIFECTCFGFSLNFLTDINSGKLLQFNSLAENSPWTMIVSSKGQNVKSSALTFQSFYPLMLGRERLKLECYFSLSLSFCVKWAEIARKLNSLLEVDAH